MPLLVKIRSDIVRKGLWLNLTAPVYRQRLWTTTNLNTIFFLGLLAVLGSLASDKLWPIIRHYLQPSLQLPDAESKRLFLSRTDVIHALRVEMEGLGQDLRVIWTDQGGIWRKFEGLFIRLMEVIVRHLDQWTPR